MSDKELIHNNTINGKCSRCGQCCSAFIPFTKTEAATIKKYVQEHNIEPVDRIDKYQLKVFCPFFNQQEHKCNIYEVRPYVCKDFICSNKDWEQKRDHYGEICNFNGTGKNNQLVSLDDVIYNDYSFTLRYLISIIIKNKINNDDQVVKLFMSCRRLDLLQYFSAVTSDNVNITGKQLFEQYINKFTTKSKYITYDDFVKSNPKMSLNMEDIK